eukprot:GHVS01008151.1.p1 GENE.GHVS01008151.1~~GHVS01008151.1.p1  ORF type:complete len:112 (+),score=4.19 GHVS01008151.1:90-425(+)
MYIHPQHIFPVLYIYNTCLWWLSHSIMFPLFIILVRVTSCPLLYYAVFVGLCYRYTSNILWIVCMYIHVCMYMYVHVLWIVCLTPSAGAANLMKVNNNNVCVCRAVRTREP